MRFERCNYNAVLWNELLANSPHANLLQSWEYGAAKASTSSWTVERGVLLDGTTRIALAQTLVRSLPLGLGGFAWLNRAPVWQTAQPDADQLRQAVAAIVTYYGAQRGLYLRLAPPFEVGLETAIPSGRGYRSTETKGWASARLDLTLSEEDLLRNLRSNWRNSLRKAEKSGIVVEIGHRRLFERFLVLHQQFIAERNFSTSVSPAFLRSLQGMLPDSQKLTVFAATQGDNLLGTVLIARFGTMCEYWAGNTSGRHSTVGIGQLLLWRAIVEMKRRGCIVFDLGGMDPDLTPQGIYTFKAGVAPTTYRLANEIEPSDLSISQKLVRAYVARKR